MLNPQKLTFFSSRKDPFMPIFDWCAASRWGASKLSNECTYRFDLWLVVILIVIIEMIDVTTLKTK